MAFRPRHLVAAGTMAGAVVLGGATWAAAQDSPSTTDDDSPTTTEEDRRSDDGQRSEDQAPRSREGCRHGDDDSGSDSSGSDSTGRATPRPACSGPDWPLRGNSGRSAEPGGDCYCLGGPDSARPPSCDAGPMAAAPVERIPYDEFSMFRENADEFGIPWDGPPVVRRDAVEVEPGRRLSALVWGRCRSRAGAPARWSPERPHLGHGGLALDRPLVAIDLPAHGHSDGPRGGFADPAGNADDVAAAVRALAPQARGVVGMSLGGLTALALSVGAPELVRSLVLVDVTPGVDEGKATSITAFVNGPESFASFDEILARTVEFNPTRTVSSLRRGILHNAVQRDDGSWVWRYARHRAEAPEAATRRIDFSDLWRAVDQLTVPLMLVRGMLPQSVVDDADEAELLRRCPDARVEHVEHAGHSVQGDTPVELAALIADFVS